MMYLGIDKGKNRHHAVLLADSGPVLLDMPFENTLEGVQELITRVGSHAGDLSGVSVGIEVKNGILIHTLLAEGFRVFPINPKNADHTRKAMTAAGVKCDRIDAKVLAAHLKQFLDRLHPLMPESDLMVQIRILVEFRQTLVADKVALENRLQAFLENYFPAAEKAFETFSDGWVMDFLADHPTPEKAKVSPKKIERWFKKNHPQVGEKIRETVKRALQAPSLTASQAVVEVESRKMLLTLSSLSKVIGQIQGVEKEIAKRFESHDDSDIFKSLPRAGKTLAPWLMSCFGENRERFPDAGSVMDFAGTSPVTMQSGGFKSVRVRRACCKTFRQAVRLFSDQSIKRPGSWSRRYYDKRREAGDHHETALRKLAKRWINILWRIWQDRVPYCEAVHVENLSKRALPMSRSEKKMAHA